MGLAPAAHGGNRTGRVFTGDRSGEWLWAALWRAGLANRPESVWEGDGLVAQGVWVTAAVRCPPPQNRPSPEERDNCLPYLERELAELGDVRAVLALGNFAYDATCRVLGVRPKPPFGHETEVPLAAGRTLGVLVPPQPAEHLYGAAHPADAGQRRPACRATGLRRLSSELSLSAQWGRSRRGRPARVRSGPNGVCGWCLVPPPTGARRLWRPVRTWVGGFFIIMLCLVVALIGTVTVVRMPVDLFPRIDMPVVVVATFYNGMPPQQIEADITNTFERFFTLGANIDHSESRSLTGVSLIKIYFKPGTDPNAALSNIANLAMADLRRLPPGTLPPVVLGMDASTQPVCLVTLKGEGLNETNLKDLAQFQVRNQISNVQGASVPQPYGGTYRQIQIYVDPLKMEARNFSLNDVVQAVNSSNLILPAGDVRIGSKDFNIYANSQFPDANSMNSMPLKSVGNSSVLVADIGKAVDSGALQYNIVRIDGQRSVYVPVFKQGGNSNTITIVNGMKAAIKHLVDIPPSSQDSGRLRSVSLRKAGNRQCNKRSGHWLSADRIDDSDFPRQSARHNCCTSFSSALDVGLPADHQLHGWVDQHHDSWRSGAGIFPAHR